MTFEQKRLAFWVGGIVLFFLLVWLFQAILFPFVAGMALAYLLDPIADRLERRGLGRGWAAALIVVGFFAIMVAAFLLLLPLLLQQVGAFFEALPKYLEELRWRLSPLLWKLEDAAGAALPQGDVKNALSQYGGKLLSFAGDVATSLLTSGIAIFNFLSLFVITPIVAFYLLRDWDAMVARLDTWLPRSQADVVREQVAAIDSVLAGFVRGQAMVCTFLAVFYAVGLTLAGLPYGLFIGVASGLLAFMPYVGTLTGGLLSIGVALATWWPDWIPIAIVAGIYAVGQVVEGNFVQPKLVGDRVGLHPVWVIFALLAGGALFGFVGVLLAVPAFAVFGVLTRFAVRRYLGSTLYRGPDPP